MVLKSVAWVGIYLLGYYDFSIAWLVTPLFLTGRTSFMVFFKKNIAKIYTCFCRCKSAMELKAGGHISMHLFRSNSSVM